MLQTVCQCHILQLLWYIRVCDLVFQNTLEQMSLDEIDQANGVLMPVYDGDVEMIYLIGKVKPLQQTYTKLIKVLLQMGSKIEPASAWFEFSLTCILPRNVIIHFMQSWEPLHVWLLAQYIILTQLQKKVSEWQWSW